MINKILSVIVCTFFFLQSILIYIPFAQADDNLLTLPLSDRMMDLSQPMQPVMLQGLRYDPQKPFQFQFILQQGDSALPLDQLRDKGMELVRYFMAAMTMSKEDLWVNLSPYEKDRIIPSELGVTRLGSNMLIEDYILKQLSSSLTFPDSRTGRAFWQKIYHETQLRFGKTDVPVSTFNKVWIVPDYADVLIKGNTVIVLDSHLKVMMEQDYLAQRKASCGEVCLQVSEKAGGDNLASQVMREVIIPVLEEQVNTGANFAALRQMFHAVVLAEWYKRNLRNSILGQYYANQHKVAGIDEINAQAKEAIYKRYLSAYKKGVYNFIREDSVPQTGEIVARKYFAGGENLEISPTMIHERFTTAEFSSQDLAMWVKQRNFSYLMDVGELPAGMAAEGLASRAMSASAKFIMEQTHNPYWYDVVTGLEPLKSKIDVIDPGFIDFFLNNIAVDEGWSEVDLNQILHKSYKGWDQVKIFWARARNAKIQKKRTQGGERFLTLRDLMEDPDFVQMYHNFLDTHPTQTEMEDFLAKYCVEEVKALDVTMGLKTARMKFGGAKGVVLMLKIVNKSGRVYLEDFSRGSKQEEDIFFRVKLAAFRLKSRIMTQKGILAYNIDGWGADMNSGFPEMEAAADEHIRVQTEGGRQNFIFTDEHGRVWDHEYDGLFALLNDELIRLRANPDTYDVTQNPFLEIMAKYKEQYKVPMPWLGITTVKREKRESFPRSGKFIYLGGQAGREDATSRGGIYMIKKLIGDAYRGQTVAVQAFGNVGRYAAFWAAHEGFRVKVINDYGITLTKTGDGFWTEAELEEIIDKIKPTEANPRGISLLAAWQKGLISKKGVDAKVLTATLKSKRDAQLEEIFRDVVGAKVDNLILAFKERQIDERSQRFIIAPRCWCLANGPVTPTAEKLLALRKIKVYPDFVVNKPGVAFSEQEALQGEKPLRVTEHDARKEVNTMLDTTLADIKMIALRNPDLHSPKEIGILASLTDLAASRLRSYIQLHGGDLNEIRLEYGPNTTIGDVQIRIERLKLEDFWEQTLIKTLPEYLARLRKPLAEVMLQYGQLLPIKYTDNDFNMVARIFTGDEKSMRLLRTFLRILDRDWYKDKLSGSGETLAEAAARLGGSNRIEFARDLRQRLLRVIGNQVERFHSDEPEYYIWKSIYEMLERRIDYLNQNVLPDSIIPHFKPDNIYPALLKAKSAGVIFNPAMSSSKADQEIDGGIDFDSSHMLINAKGLANFAQISFNSSAEWRHIKGLQPIFLRLVPVNLAKLIGVI